MPKSIEELYNQRLNRYYKAMQNEKPDKVPIRPFIAETIGKIAGMNNQQITHVARNAFDAAFETFKQFDWDAATANMVNLWTGMTESYGTTYFKVPGIQLDVDETWQYLEPATDEEALLRPDEYDRFIEDPTEFVQNVWTTRASKYFLAPGQENTSFNNMAWLKAGVGFVTYLNMRRMQVERMRNELGLVSAICGALKAPFDIMADSFRGFRGVSFDLFRRPDQLLKAVEAVAPHMKYMALAGADPNKKLPICLWLHRGATGFFSPEVIKKFFWPTLREITEEIFSAGHQTIYYGEGRWVQDMDLFLELPEKSIIFHCDKDDIFEVHKKIGHKFAISGGIPNDLLAFGTPAEVREVCRNVISEIAQDGGYIMDAEAIMQNDVRTENLQAMTDACNEYGVY
jgi:uroporphyrinogen-III decarboxylase